MNKKLGLSIVIVAIVTMAIFTGCIEEETSVSTPTISKEPETEVGAYLEKIDSIEKYSEKEFLDFVISEMGGENKKAYFESREGIEILATEQEGGLGTAGAIWEAKVLLAYMKWQPGRENYSIANQLIGDRNIWITEVSYDIKNEKMIRITGSEPTPELAAQVPYPELLGSVSRETWGRVTYEDIANAINPEIGDFEGEGYEVETLKK